MPRHWLHRYLALFHSSVTHDPDGRPNGHGKRRTYYMGGVVYAPRPPFAIQQVRTAHRLPLECCAYPIQLHNQLGTGLWPGT